MAKQEDGPCEKHWSNGQLEWKGAYEDGRRDEGGFPSDRKEPQVEMPPTKMWLFRRTCIYLAAAFLLTGCDDDGLTKPELEGGILALFEVAGERFSAFVTNPDAISAILALEAGTSQASIPNGRLIRGPGPAEYNLPWSWHIDPVDIEMAELTIELCDARPSFVENNLDEWIDVVGRFCPWGAHLVSVDDLR